MADTITNRKRRAWLSAALLASLAALGAQARDLPDFTKLVKENSAAVVNISTETDVSGTGREQLDEFYRWFFGPNRQAPDRPRPQSLGSGFVISDDGYILTNNHVVSDADRVLVRFSDRRELEAEIVGLDPRSDLALIKVDAQGLPTVRIGRSQGLQVGEWVLAIGSPFGFDYSVTAGIVSAIGRSLRNESYVPFIQTDVAINPGNSGGPLFNLDGEVVGINSQIYTRSGGFMGVSFAIPIDVAMEVVEQLKTTGRVSRGWLGVVIQEVNKELAESFELDRPHGALVADVLAGSPAEEAGLQIGDVIVEFNGQTIDLSAELPQHVGRTTVGKAVPVIVVRDGERMRLSVTIGELEDGEAAIARQNGGGGDTRLGLVVEPLPESRAEELAGIGVQVTAASGAAAEAGIRAGDIILQLNNQKVKSVAGFHEIAADIPRGRSVPVLITRGNVRTFIALRVPD